MNIGAAVVRRLLAEREALVFNLDTCGYAGDLTSLEQVLAELGRRPATPCCGWISAMPKPRRPPSRQPIRIW